MPKCEYCGEEIAIRYKDGHRYPIHVNGYGFFQSLETPDFIGKLSEIANFHKMKY